MKTNKIIEKQFFFGSDKKHIYGCYYTNEMNMQRLSVLLCYPFGHEYIRSHRVYRQLATMLAENGFSVLKFDYYGTGDSDGAFDDASPTDWIDDIKIAVVKLRNLCKSDKVCVIGLRFGALLASNATSEIPEVDTIVLWEPIFDGHKYLAGMKEMHMAEYEKSKSKNVLTGDNKVPLELNGYKISKKTIEDLKNLNINVSQFKNKQNILFVTSNPCEECVKISKSLRALHYNIQNIEINEQKIWLMEPYKAIVPAKTIDYICSWVDKVDV